MRPYFLLLSGLFLLVLTNFTNPVKASHWSGVNITTECLNACTIRVYSRLYRDCGGAVSINPNFNFANAAPGCSLPVALGGFSPEFRTEISPVCPSVQTTCTSASSLIYGTEEIMVYRDFTVCGLGTNCTYDIEYTDCCRNGSQTNGAANQSGSVINHVNFSQGCNSSPVFSGPPISRLCVAQPLTVHQGAMDPDGDSLVYSLAACLGGSPGYAPIPYGTGYSPTAPLGASWNFNLDPGTGLLEIIPTPGNVETGPVCIKTEEYRNGNLIGSTFRDLQVIVFPCSTNAQPAYTAFSNLSSGATQLGPDTIGYCGTSQLCFDIGVTDADTSAGQIVTLSWDGGISGATFTEVGNATVQNTISGNSPDGRFCWTPPSPGTYSFNLTAVDDACPFFLQHDKVITIIVAGSPPAVSITATGSLDTCNGTTVTLDAGGGYSSYLWSNGAITQTITVGTAGTYSVSAGNGGICNATGSFNVLNQPVPQITGTMFTSTAVPLTGAKMYLIRHDASTNALYAEDSTFTDGFGNYSFCGVALDTMYVKAAPDSALYPSEIPTYADTAIWWNNAEMVLAANFPLVKSFQTRFGANPGGSGFIGGLISQGANKTNAPGDPMPNVTVILYNKTLNQFVDMTTSDANGYFSFSNIPLGDYEVSVDVPGVDHIVIPSLVLDGSAAVQDSLDFRLHTTYFELVLPTAVRGPGFDGLSLEVFPNPITIGSASGLMTIALELPEDADVNLQLVDLTGKVVRVLENRILNGGTHRWQLDFAENGLSAGMYFLQLRGRNQGGEMFRKVHKIVVTID